ncbi:hypothetical protein SCA6_004978 [Theobroma cacao]
MPVPLAPYPTPPAPYTPPANDRFILKNVNPIYCLVAETKGRAFLRNFGQLQQPSDSTNAVRLCIFFHYPSYPSEKS